MLNNLVNSQDFWATIFIGSISTILITAMYIDKYNMKKEFEKFREIEN